MPKAVRATTCCELGRPSPGPDHGAAYLRADPGQKQDPAMAASTTSGARVSSDAGAPPRLGRGNPSSAARRSAPPLTKLAPLSPRGRGADDPHPASVKWASQLNFRSGWIAVFPDLPSGWRLAPKAVIAAAGAKWLGPTPSCIHDCTSRFLFTTVSGSVRRSLLGRSRKSGEHPECCYRPDCISGCTRRPSR